MTSSRIPEDNHVTRLCGWKGCPDGKPLGAAFKPRAEKDDYLSVIWLEHTQGPTKQNQLARARNQLQAINMRLTRYGWLAVLELGRTFEHIRIETAGMWSLYACPEPIYPDAPSHAGIYGFTPEDEMIADMIAFTVIDVQPAQGEIDTTLPT